MALQPTGDEVMSTSNSENKAPSVNVNQSNDEGDQNAPLYRKAWFFLIVVLITVILTPLAALLYLPVLWTGHTYRYGRGFKPTRMPRREKILFSVLFIGALLISAGKFLYRGNQNSTAGRHSHYITSPLFVITHQAASAPFFRKSNS